MKLFSIILSVIFVVLSTIPCADSNEGDVCVNSERTACEKKNADEKKTSDLCSPFCICGCCMGVVLSISTITTFETVLTPELLVKQETFYKEPSKPNFSKSIWQPPQLV